jgi:hypothetical protein
MTEQIEETLEYNRYAFRMKNSEPLEAYLEKRNIVFEAPHTACWRGYVGTWLLENDQLYLIRLNANLRTSDDMEVKEVGMDYLFPGQRKVFAEWFSGELCLGVGKYLFHRYVYEKEIYLKFVNGKVVSRRAVDNTRPKEEENLPDFDLDSLITQYDKYYEFF